MKSAFVGGEKLMHLENLEATSTHGHATRDGTLRARAEDDHEAEDDPLVLSRRGTEGGAGCLLAPMVMEEACRQHVSVAQAAGQPIAPTWWCKGSPPPPPNYFGGSADRAREILKIGDFARNPYWPQNLY